jgi:hypothetical protein
VPPASNFRVDGRSGLLRHPHGDDSVTGTVRNLVLPGGAISVDLASGNVLNRISSLRIRMQVPEPSGAAGLLIGAGVLLGFFRRWR